MHGILGYQKLIYKNYCIDQVTKMAGIIIRVSWDIWRVGKVESWSHLHLRYRQTRSLTNIGLLLGLGLVITYREVQERLLSEAPASC